MFIQFIEQALMMSIIVGTILNLINQKGLFKKGIAINYLSVCLNYLVPFTVSFISMNIVS
jgi:hypothetical protein